MRQKNYLFTKLIICTTIYIGTTGGQSYNCQLDDVIRTPGTCTPIKQCRFAIGQLYANAPVKRCLNGPGKDAVCCPTQPTLSQKKCQEWKKILMRPEVFSQAPPAQPLCGYKGSVELIVGGRGAYEFEFPHAVGLGYGNNPSKLQYLCGATLISNRYLLTAAHCLSNKNSGKPRWAVIGDLTLNTETSIYRKKLSIVDWIPHPNYSAPLIYNDIAILKLEEGLEVNRYVLPACLGDPLLTPKDGGSISAIGWGQTGFGERLANTLQAVNLTVINTKTCNTYFDEEADKNFRYPQGFVRSQLCAGDRSDSSGTQIRKDTCNGDSGGGVVINPEIKCLYHVVGVTSIGSKYCGYGEPGVYTKVASYIDWIERVIWAQ